MKQCKSDIDEQGYFILDGVDSEFLLDLAQTLGQIRVENRSPEPIRDIRPQSIAEAKENPLSSRFGTGPFPFHTDVAYWEKPARFVVLYCHNPGGGSRPTHLQDSHSWELGTEARQFAMSEVWKVGHA